jgi:hypothetical protein
MAVASTLAVVGAVAAVGGTALSLRAQQKAASRARKRDKVASRRSRRQAIREAQIRRAQALASAQGAGAQGSSAEFGGIGSITSRLGERLGFGSQIGALNRSIASAQSQASLFSGIASIGANAFQLGGGLDALSKPPENQPGFTFSRSSPRPVRSNIAGTYGAI